LRGGGAAEVRGGDGGGERVDARGDFGFDVVDLGGDLWGALALGDGYKEIVERTLRLVKVGWGKVTMTKLAATLALSAAARMLDLNCIIAVMLTACGERDDCVVEVIAMCDEGELWEGRDRAPFYYGYPQASEDLPDTAAWIFISSFTNIHAWDVRSSLRRLSPDSSGGTAEQSLAWSSAYCGVRYWEVRRLTFAISIIDQLLRFACSLRRIYL
jgi:hypothetical protein